jgi:hypothetical protein
VKVAFVAVVEEEDVEALLVDAKRVVVDDDDELVSMAIILLDIGRRLWRGKILGFVQAETIIPR